MKHQIFMLDNKSWEKVSWLCILVSVMSLFKLWGEKISKISQNQGQAVNLFLVDIDSELNDKIRNAV